MQTASPLTYQVADTLTVTETSEYSLDGKQAEETNVLRSVPESSKKGFHRKHDA